MKVTRLIVCMLLSVTCVAGLAEPAGVEKGAVHFGQQVPLGPGMTATITRQASASWLSRFPEDLPADVVNLAVFELRVVGDAGVFFATNRSDPSKSDIVALCGEHPVNTLKIAASKTRVQEDTSHDEPFGIGHPGAFQRPTDGRWVTLLFTRPESVIYLFFALPDTCAPKDARLSVVLEVGEDKKKLLFSERAAPPAQ